MKRDMDLIRKLALHIESTASECLSSAIKLDGFTDEQIMYHCQLMSDAGLIESTPSMQRDVRYSDLIIFRLSWSGHEFVDAARNDTIWNTVNEHVKKTAISVTFDGLKSILRQAGQQVVIHGAEWLIKSDWSWLQILPS